MIDGSMTASIYRNNDLSDLFEISKLNDEVDNLISLNPSCWGVLNNPKDTWTSYGFNKDILFNNKVFDEVSEKIKNSILEYMMSLKVDTIKHQVHLFDSSVVSCKSNPYKKFYSEDCQHFTGFFFLRAKENSGNLIFRNPFSFGRRFPHNGDSPLKNYHIVPNREGSLVIFPAHIEYKMNDLNDDNDLRYILFNVTVA